MVSLQEQENVVNYLNEYCFEEIWSAVAAQYRANFQLLPVDTRLQTARFVFDDAVGGLPTTGMYRVFYFDKTMLRGSWNQADGKWHSTDEIANQCGVKFSVYDINGHLLPMSKVFVTLPTHGEPFFVAVDKDALMKCIPEGLSTDLYFTVFKTTELKQVLWKINSSQVTNVIQTNGVIGAGSRIPNTVFIINGSSYTSVDNLPSIQNGDYVDVIVDPTILTTYVVQVDETNNGYQSVKFSDHREILHCPKAQNPNNDILTHDNATLFVRDSQTGIGVYFHRCDPDSVHQITHNDLSASRQTINSFKAALNASMVEVVVQVRAICKPKTLMIEAGWINDLYISDDAQIIQLLRGEYGSNLSFWEAATLEQSGYVSLMFNVGDSEQPSLLENYVDALGYYRTAAILSHSVYVGSFEPSDMVFTKSFFQTGKDITPLVYVGGKKQLQTNVTSLSYTESQSGVSLSNQLLLTPGSECIIRVLEAGELEPFEFVPTSTNSSVTLPSNISYVVYQKNTVPEQTGWTRSSTVSYTPIPLSDTTYQVYQNSNGQNVITFSEGCFNNTYVMISDRFMWYQQNNIDDLLQTAQPLIFPIEIQTSSGNYMPVLNYSNVEVYINGNYLVKDVDFTLGIVRDSNNGVMLIDLLVSCASYLELEKTGNVLEIYISTDYPTNIDEGYVVNGVLPRKNLISFWFPSISSAFIEGVPTVGLIDKAVYMEASSSIGNGSLFSLKPLLPASTISLLEDFSPYQDEINIEAINEFYQRTTPPLPDLVPVTVEHQLYSPFLTAVMSEMVKGTFVPILDPNDSSFLEQFSQFSYLQNNDPTCSNSNPSVNRNFLSIAACYTQPPTMTIEQTKIIQKLISLTLITKPVVIQETLV